MLIHVDDPVDYRRITEKLKRLSDKALVVSGYADDKQSIARSGVVHFHESILETFSQYPVEILCEYRDTTMILVRLDKRRRRLHYLWTYWETPKNGSRPPYLDLCEETWHRHCGDDFKIVKVTPETVQDYVPDLIPEWRQIPVLAHKADYLRAVLVQRFGGIWLDSDIIVLKNLKVLNLALISSVAADLAIARQTASSGDRPARNCFINTLKR